ncbi:MAG: hypothetical protein ACI8UO_001757 [Verrucomicrobiales bacterium]|jgi:hypothetical protein
MKQTIKAIGCIVVGAGLLSSAQAEGGKIIPTDPVPVCEVPFTGSVSVGYDTDYYHRGQQWGENNVSAAVGIDYSLSASMNLALDTTYNNIIDPAGWDRLVSGAWGEFDLMGLEAGVGFNWYYYPEASNDDTYEVGLRLGTTVGPIDIDFGYYYDFESSGNYFELGGSKTIALGDCLDLNLGGGIGYGDENYVFDGIVNGGDHVYATVGLTYHLTETASVSGYITGNWLYDDLEALSGGDDEDVYGGASIRVNF